MPKKLAQDVSFASTTNESIPVSRLDKMEASIEQLAQAVNLLLTKDVPQETVPLEQTPLGRESDEKDTDGRIIPQSWIAILQKNLGKDFTFELQEGGAGSFGVKVIFPAHIDRRIGTERSTGPRDISMFSPIRLASPLPDLESWCKLCIQTIKRVNGFENFIPKQ